jgi:anti-sigma regulatory factor (Ser/Thr protein kinase)
MTAAVMQHAALPYSGRGGFVRAATGVVRGSLERDTVPVVLARPRDVTRVRSALGRRGRDVLGVDMSVAGRNPARVLPMLQHLLDEHPDCSLSCVIEAVRPDDPAPVVGEVELYELLLALPAFHGWNCRLTCLYDEGGLPPRVVEMIEAAHGEQSAERVTRLERARGEPLPPRPMSSEELGVDRTTLSALRGFVQRRAEQAGLDSERVDDLVYAVNEGVTNSICHGEGRARVSFWIEDRAVVCEVRDRGWIRDPLVGRIAPRPDTLSGRGLWLVNQLCDLVQLRSSPSGTTLRMHVDI